MNKTALTGLAIALLLPFVGYFLVTQFGKSALHMPRHYFYDSVMVKEKGGKTNYDTAWHQVRNISLTNQLGNKVSLDDLKGKIIVADMIFTRCPSVCPNLTKSMRRLQQSFEKNPEFVHFISFSVDPEFDSVPKLRAFADKYNSNQDNWWFVTGDKKDIYDFAFSELKAGLADTEVDGAFIHTQKIFLLDTNRIVRGFYDGTDTIALKQLVNDIPTLMLEKGKNSKSVFRGFIPVLPYIFAGVVFVLLVMFFLNKKRN